MSVEHLNASPLIGRSFEPLNHVWNDDGNTSDIGSLRFSEFFGYYDLGTLDEEESNGRLES